MKFEGDKIDESSEKEESFSKKEKLTEKMRENPWILSTLVLGILILILLVGNFSGGVTGNVISEKDAGDIILNFVKTQTNGQGELVETTVFDNVLYKVVILYQGNEVPLYLTKDGKNLVQGILPLESIEEQKPSQSEEVQDVSKSDKPKAELFIMTHCPYGAQAEKGIIPAIKALGNSAGVKIRFVHYFMHGDKEETETYNQVCIREEQSAKYLDYLQCFLEDGNSSRCITKIGIDKTKLETCKNTKAKDYYAEDSKLSETYGVQGSPTLVVNGIIASSGRDSASYLNTICSAFNNAPEECNEELSTASPSPGFGTGTGSSASTANCGA